MNYEDEKYVRVYTRKTLTFKLIGWEGRAVLWHLMLEVDRAGVLDLNGEDPVDAVVAMTDVPVEVTRVGLGRLLARGVVSRVGDVLLIPNFLEAQEAKQTDAHRQRESREKRRDLAMREEVLNVTNRDTGERKPVTDVTEPVKTVTLSLTSLAVPAELTDPHKPPTGGETAPSGESREPNPAALAPDATADAGQKPRQESREEAARRVFEFWQKEHGHPLAKFDRKRRSRILARLAEGFTVRELCLAIRGAKQDKFLMGDGGRVYDGIQTILRDADQVERLVDLANSKNGVAVSATEAQAAQARRRAERRERLNREVELKQPASGTMPSARTIELVKAIGGA